MKRLILVVALFFAAHAQAQTAADQIAAGRAALVAHDLAGAKADFQAALTLEPANQTAAALLGFTRLFALEGETAAQTLMDDLGVPAAGRDLYHDWTAELPSDPVHGGSVLPTTFNSSGVFGFWHDTLVPECENARANLAVVTDPSFLLTLSAAETTSPASMNIDYGDVLTARASLRAVEFALHFLQGQNLNVYPELIRELANGNLLSLQGLLTDYPDLLKPGTSGERAAARSALLDFIQTYRQASAAIRSRAAGVQRMYVLDSSQIQAEADFRTGLATLERSLTEFVEVDPDGPMICLGPLFTDAFSLRALLPPITNGSFDPFALPDPTAGGVFSAWQREWLVRNLGKLAKADLGWQALSPTAANVTFNGLTTGGGSLYVFGSGGVMLSSTDGTTYAPVTTNTTSNLMACAQHGGTAVVVGSGGTILTSSDGATWTPQTSHTTSDLNGIAYANGQFVAVGAGGTILTSPNGSTWTTQSSGVTAIQVQTYSVTGAVTLYDVAYGNGQYVAVGGLAGSGSYSGWNFPVMFSSTDGSNWSHNYDTYTWATALRGVVFHDGRFTAAGTNGVVLNSTDGVMWNFAGHTGALLNDFLSIRVLDDGRYWMTTAATSADGQAAPPAQVLVSSDGLQWIPCPLPTAQSISTATLFQGRVYVAGAAASMLRTGNTIAAVIAPTVFQAPPSLAVGEGTAVALAAGVTGEGVLSYQWRKDGVNIDGATGRTLTFDNPLTADSGSYTVTVTNDAGSVTSSAGVLAVTPQAPVITEQPVSASVPLNQSARFAVTAVGSPTLTYHWKKDGVDLADGGRISGATTATLTLTGAQDGDAGSYSVMVTNGLGSTPSEAATLTVTAAAPANLLWAQGQLARMLSAPSRTTPKIVADGVKAAASGSSHSLYLKTDGTLWAMGQNSEGQLGDGTTTDRSTPVQVAGGVATMAAGSNFSLYLKTDGTLWGMGSNGSGQLGDGTQVSRSTPVQVATGVTAIAAGNSHSLFVTADGTLWATGNNYNGQLGDGTTTSRTTPVQVATGVTAIAAGSSHSLYVTADGTLWAMGYNYNGRLGDGTTTERHSPVQVATGVQSVAAGDSHSLFVRTDGTLWATGYNYSGQLGDGTTADRSTPVQVDSGVATVAAGSTFSLYLKTDATLWTMGYNGGGQLADGTTTSRSTPMAVATGVQAVAAGAYQSLFVKTAGTLWVVGDDYYGQLGDGVAIPEQVLVASDVVAAGIDSTNALYVKTDGTLWSRSVSNRAPVQVASGVAKACIGAYGQRRLYLKGDRTLWALATDNTSTQIASDVVSAGAGLDYVAYLTSDGTLWGQGGDSWAIQFGNGTSPTQVATNVVSFSAAGWHILYVTGDQALWGMGYPWMGFDNTHGPWISTPGKLETGILGAVADPQQNLTLRTDGTLWSRGDGWSSEVGPAVQVDGNVVAAAAGETYSLYVKSNGTLWSRPGIQGSLGAPVQLAGGVVSVVGGSGSTAFIQQGSFGAAPVIAAQPQAVGASVGASTSLQVSVNGIGPFAYQWYKDGVAIDGARGAHYTITYATAADAGSYTVVITNSVGSVTSSAGVLTVMPHAPVITEQPANASVPMGQIASFAVTAVGSPTLTYQWKKDGTDLADGGRISGATTDTLTLTGVQAGDAGSYSVVVTNGLGSTPSSAATLTAMSVDPVFLTQLTPGTSEQSPGRTVHDGQGHVYLPFTIFDRSYDVVGGRSIGALARLNEATGALDPTFRLDRSIRRVAYVVVQLDGKLVLSADIGDTATVVRVDSTGALDPTFSAPAFGRDIRFMTMQPDGKILVAAVDSLAVSAPAGAPAADAAGIFRLNADGTLDSAFTPVLFDSGPVFSPPVLDASNRIYVAGAFTAINGTARKGIARLSRDGVLDAAYADPATLPAGFTARNTRSIGLQSDGKAVVVGRMYSTARGTVLDPVVAIRLNADGAVDNTFAFPLRSAIGLASGCYLRAMIVQPDDKFIAVSDHLLRFNADGTVDSTFVSRAFGGEAYWVSRGSDGRIYVPNVGTVAGDSGTIPLWNNGVAAFSAIGVPDASFQTGGWGLSAFPTAAAVLSDGRVWVAGNFNNFGGAARPGLAQFTADGALNPTLAVPTGPDGYSGLANAALAAAGNDQVYVLWSDNGLAGNPTGYTQLSRLNADGSVDSAFSPQLALDYPLATAVPTAASGGDLLLAQPSVSAGDVIAGNSSRALIRLLPGGALDVAFPALPNVASVMRDSGNNITSINVGGVRVLQVLADNRMLVAVNGVDGNVTVYRLMADGSMDSSLAGRSFGPITAFTGFTNLLTDPLTNSQDQFNLNDFSQQKLVTAAVQLADGRIYVGGRVGGNGLPTGLVRLNADGTPDASFAGAGAANASSSVSAPFVSSLALDAAGRLYVAGEFDHFDGVAVPGIFRLNPDGTLDTGWNPGMAVLPHAYADVKLLVAGGSLYAFGEVGGATDLYPGSYRVADARLPQTIGFPGLPDKTYGDAPFDVDATASSGGPVTFSVVSGNATISGGLVTITGAGPVTIEASQAGGALFEAATVVDRTFTVAKAPLTAKADDQTRPQYAANPALTITYTGFVLGETSAVLATPPTAGTNADVDSPVGTYPITLNGGGDDNYSLTLVTGTLTVSAAPYTAFLQQLFQDVLGRAADPGALSSFGSAMAAGLTRAAVLDDLYASVEYNNRQIEPAIRLYYAALARLPDYGGLQNWSNNLHAGVLSLVHAADQFAGSQEFLNKYGSLDNTGYVQQLYRNVLGREADPSGLADWVGQLDRGASRGQILVGFSESDEFKGNTADQVEILRLFYLFDQRMPTDVEMNQWIGFLKGYGETDALFGLGYPSGLADPDYVQLVFQGFLRRSADAGTLGTFGDAMAAGTVTHGSLVETLMNSTEFNLYVGPVSRLYLSALLRVPDAPGLDNWVNYAKANSLQTVADQFAASQEFQNRYGAMDDTAYVTALYENILGREPDPSGLADWVGRLGSGTATRSQILIGFAQSQEAIHLFAPTVRTFLHYFTFLNTAPTPQQLQTWASYMATLDGQMRQTFLDSL